MSLDKEREVVKFPKYARVNTLCNSLVRFVFLVVQVLYKQGLSFCTNVHPSHNEIFSAAMNDIDYLMAFLTIFSRSMCDHLYSC